MQHAVALPAGRLVVLALSMISFFRLAGWLTCSQYIKLLIGMTAFGIAYGLLIGGLLNHALPPSPSPEAYVELTSLLDLHLDPSQQRQTHALCTCPAVFPVNVFLLGLV